MVTREQIDESLDRARRWREATGTAVHAADLELIVRLGVRSPEVARRVLLEDGGAVLAALDGIWSAVDGRPVAAAEPEPEPEPEPEAEPAEEATPEASVSRAAAHEPGEGTREAARLEALRAWFTTPQPDGSVVDSDVVDADLVAIAALGPQTLQEFKRFRSPVRRYQAQLLDVVKASEAAWKAPAPAAPSQPEPPVEQATPHSTAAASPAPDGAPAVTSTTSAVEDDVQRLHGETSLVSMDHYDFSRIDRSAEPPPAVRFDATGEESLHLSWPPAPVDGQVHIFTVITSSEFAPTVPTVGNRTVSTYDDQTVDTSFFDGPVRYVTVWRSSGLDDASARASQPVLWAQAATVLPVRNCRVREDEGTVIGDWDHVEGLSGFDVYRIPVGRGEEARREINPLYKVTPPEAITSSGFTDRNAVPGMDYEYRVFARAPINEALGPVEKTSPPVARRMTLEAVAQPVFDLQVDKGGTTFDLSWTPPDHPMARVEIYRTPQPPPSGLDRERLDRTALVGAGLTAEFKVARPENIEDGRVFLRDIPWPQEWSRAYFTPVTVLSEELIQVGPWQSDVRNEPPTGVRLVERVTSEFLTFAWPLGSSAVHVYQTPRHSPLTDPKNTPSIFQIGEDDYRKYGGAHLPHPLPADGCAVHLVSVSYSAGQARYSTPKTIDYEGLSRLRYRIESVPTEARGRRAAAPSADRRIVVYSESGPNLTLVLVHHPDRLPLYAGEGKELARRQIAFTAGSEQVFIEPLSVPGAGYIRVFADIPAAHAHKVAVLDPPLRDLRIGPPVGP